MKFIMSGIAIVSILSVRFAHAQCGGASLSTLVTGDKSLAIEVTTYPSLEKKYAIDDDGLVALNIAASFCYDSIERPSLELSNEARTCADQVQEAILPGEQISFYSYQESMMTKTTANDAIKAKCKIDVIAEWRKAKEVAETKPLSCAPGVKKLIDKATARIEEFAREQTTPKKLAELFDSPADRTLFTSQIQESTKRAKNFSRLMTTPPVNERAFKAAFEDLKKANGQNTYAYVNATDEVPTAESLKSIDFILGAMGSHLPYNETNGARRRRGRTRCEAPGINQYTIDIIANSDWKSNSSAGAPSRPVKSTTQGAK